MRRIQLILLISILFISVLKAQSDKKYSYLKPTNYQNTVATIISGKTRSYYSLSAFDESVIIVRGPGKLRVMTRGQFVPNEDDNIEYEILYNVDGSEQEIFSKSDVERSERSTYLYDSLGVPGELKDFEIELGRGYHTIEFKLKEKEIPVAVRYKFIPTKAEKKEWISFSPVQPSEPVDLVTREKIVAYYRFSTDKPLKVEINGPTELRVLTRIENHYQMKGRIHYRVQVTEQDKVVNTYQLSSRRSEVTAYKNNNELIPGKACEFVIDVPRGKHSYEIISLDQDKNSLLGRFLLPVKDVGLVD